MLTTVLFDLDGTLLPMDEEKFVQDYFRRLVMKLAPHGYDKEGLVSSIWAGTKAMIQNDGTNTNEQVFWKFFSQVHGEQYLEDMPLFDEFYRNEFQEVRNICGFLPEAKAVVTELKDMGLRVVLATNPLFPFVATHSRIRWAGLQPEDFEYITTYENSHYCKPNLNYYSEILDQRNLSPQECIMVGNNAEDDMIASQLGMKTFLCTKCLINNKEMDLTQLAQGQLTDLIPYIKTQLK